MKLLNLTTLRYLAIIPMMFVALSFFSPSIVSAQRPADDAVIPGGGGAGQQPAGGGGTGQVPGGGGGQGTPKFDTVTLQNPLNGINSIQALLEAILNIIMILMIPVIVFFIIYAGFKYVMAQGNASQVEEATRALTYAIIGGVLILGAVAISQIIRSVVDAF